jgi:hypothetical protein
VKLGSILWLIFLDVLWRWVVVAVVMEAKGDGNQKKKWDEV